MARAALGGVRTGLIALTMPLAVLVPVPSPAVAPAASVRDPVSPAELVSTGVLSAGDVSVRSVSTAVRSQGPGGGPGGGSDGGSDGGTDTGGVIPNPQPPSDTDGGDAAPAPEPRRPTPGSAGSTDGGARRAPPTTPDLPPPPDQPTPDNPNPMPPGRPDVPAPGNSGSVWASASGSAGSGSAPAAVSGSQALMVDLETASALRDYERTRRPETRGADLGGPEPFVTQTPILLRDAGGRFGTATLFQVAVAGRGMRMLDASGARFTDLEDYLEDNRLPADWTVIYPESLSLHGDSGRLISAPAHTRTVWQRLREGADGFAATAAFSGMGLVFGGPDSSLDSAPVIGRYQPGRDLAVTDAR